MEYSCLSCHCPIEYAPSPAGAKPAPGNFAACLNCGHLMAFAGDMSFRKLTGEEAANLSSLDVGAMQRPQYPIANIILDEQEFQNG
jgi:hypothetical protein